MIPLLVAVSVEPAIDLLTVVGRAVLAGMAFAFLSVVLWVIWIYVFDGIRSLGRRYQRWRRGRVTGQLRIVTREHAEHRELRARNVWKTGTSDVPKWHPPRSRSDWEGGPPKDGGLPHAS